MVCQLCGKADATIKITRIVNKAVEELHVCEDCAVKASPYNAKMAKKKQIEKLSVENLLKDLLQQQEGALVIDPKTTEPARIDSISCPTCGLEFEKYKRTYMLGCPSCYDSFGEKLLSDIRKIQGAERHVGEPRPAPEPEFQDVQTQLRALRAELDEAVENEDFERAVVIRDHIKKLAG